MKFLQCSVLCLSLYFSTSLSAEEPLEHEEKIYLKPNQIRIDERGIFVGLSNSNQAVTVTGIHRDGNGLYVLASEYKLSRCPRGHYSPDGDGLCDEPGCPYNR